MTNVCSFPCKQEGLAVGKLTNWTKGFKCSGVEGEDVVTLLKRALHRRGDVYIEVRSRPAPLPAPVPAPVPGLRSPERHDGLPHVLRLEEPQVSHRHDPGHRHQRLLPGGPGQGAELSI